MSSMQLPESLHPWRSWLSWFAPSLAPEIGQMVQRLSPLLGPLRGSHQSGPPEPDGLGDLRSRGPYERLLNSEWLLADEMPDEFLRRAATGEHLFLSPRPRAQRAARQIIALFDAGPMQLGAPRLAHIAMWILLARRAAEAGAELQWGTVQAPGLLRTTENAAQLQKLLSARTYTASDARHWVEWQAYIDKQVADLGECWYIGDEARSPATMLTYQVNVQRALDSDALDIILKEGLRRSSLLLPLPATQAAAQLLKNGIAEVKSSTRAHGKAAKPFAITRPPILSPGGTQVAVTLLGSKDVHVFPIKKTASTPKAKPHQLPRHAEPLTLAFQGQRLGAMVSGNDQLLFWNIRHRAIPRPPRELLQAATGRATWLASAWVRQHDAERFYLLDEAGRLVCWQCNPGPHNPPAQSADRKTVAEHVLGLTTVNQQTIAYARRADTGEISLHFDNGNDKSARRYGLAFVPDATTVHFACDADWPTRFGAIAVASRPTRWHILSSPPTAQGACGVEVIPLSSDHLCIGLAKLPDANSYALVVLSPNRRNVLLWRKEDAVSTVFSSPNKVVQADFDSASGLIAMLTDERELIVYSVLEKAIRVFLHSKEAAHEPA